MNSSINESTTMTVNASSMARANVFEISTQIGMIAAYSIIFVLALSGNVLIIHIVVSKPYMRSTINFLIANMAAADLLMTLFAMPYSVFYLYHESEWFGGVFGHLTCKAVHFTIGLSIAASISTLIVISLDRFFAIVYPFRRSSVIKKIPITITTTWVTSALLLSPYLYIYEVQFHLGIYKCVVSIGDNTLRSLGIYHAVTFLVLYVIPLVSIAAFYFAVCRKLWLRKIPGNPSAMNLRSANRSKKKTIKMLIIIVVVFAVCWLPAHMMHMLIFFNYNTYLKFPKYVPLVAFFISHANSAINPFLYITLNKNFMHAFKDITESLKYWRTHSARRSKSMTSTSMTNLSIVIHENQMMTFRSSPKRRTGKYKLNSAESNNIIIENLKQVSLVSGSSCVSTKL